MNKLDRLINAFIAQHLIGAFNRRIVFLIPSTSPNKLDPMDDHRGLVAIISLGIWLFISLFRSRSE